jgi:glycosyltransferase involved in cell wall biosynthesis
MNTADVTAIIPVFNGGPFLAEALRCVLEQRPGEVIVVDDGSQDATAEVVRAFPAVRYLRHERNRGPAAARNTGLAAARGALVAFLDADDVWTADKLELQLGHLRRQPELEVVLGRLRFWHTPANSADTEAHLVYSFGAALFRKAVFDRVGAIDEALRFGEDTDWFLKLRERQIATLVHDDVVLLYRRHQHNMTLQRTAQTRTADLFSVLRQSVKRRQGQGAMAALPALGRRR